MERGAFLADCGGEALRGIAAGGRKSVGGGLDFGQQRVGFGLHAGEVRFLTLELLGLAGGLLAVGDHVGDAVAPAAFEFGDQREARLDFGEAGGIDHDRVGVGAQFACGVGGVLGGGLQ